jgi:catechol 2,3-dioxygenase
MKLRGDDMSMYHDSKSMHIQSATLLIRDLKRSIEFYRDILGFRLIENASGKASFGASDHQVILQLIEHRAALPFDLTLGLYHIAYLVPSRTQLAEVIYRLKKNKYPVTGASDHGVSEALYLDDPDGNGIEIYCDRDASQWPMENGQMTMYTKRMDILDVMRHLPEEPSLTMHPDTQIGHLHFHVKDLKEAEVFYCEILGFKPILNFMKSALFISDQGYHHHVGLNTWNGPAPIPKEKQVGLKSYVLHVPKDQYPNLMRRLSHHHIPLIVDDDQRYIVDLLNQRIYFSVEQ